jgi:hypothetical protein
LQQNENKDNDEPSSLLSSIEQGTNENNELGSSLSVVVYDKKNLKTTTNLAHHLYTTRKKDKA